MRVPILALVTVLCSRVLLAQDYEYKPFVEEGKTWWYSQRVPLNKSGDEYEYRRFGLSLLGDSIIEGVTWKKIIPVIGKNTPVYEDAVGLIRENDHSVYTQRTISTFSVALESALLYGCDNGLLFDFNSEVGDSIFNVPVTMIDTICGRKAYVFNSLPPQYHDYLFEGIGFYSSEYRNGNLFWEEPEFMPTGIDIAWPPQLCWVTDANLNILFTGRGGPMPWEQGLVEEVVTEPCGEAVYFNLQGQPCAEPLSPGIYIRRQGSRAAKVAIK